MSGTFFFILLASLLGGVVSIAAAALLAFRLPKRSLSMLVAFATGVILSSAFLEILPEAFADFSGEHRLQFAVLLAGILLFYFLEHWSVWGHTHGETDIAESNACQRAVPLILVGDAFHNFVDGILIAAAFLVDPWLGVTTTAAVILHEIPQEIGDFAILLDAGWSKRNAFLANAASSLASVVGGVLGYFALRMAEALTPYFLIIAASSFVYIAIADLMPLLRVYQRRDGFLAQTLIMAAGIAIVPALGYWLH